MNKKINELIDSLIALPTTVFHALWMLVIIALFLPIILVVAAIGPRKNYPLLGDWLRDRVRVARTGEFVSLPNAES
jgi:hypothetical protein